MRAQFLMIGIALVGLLPGCAAVEGIQRDKVENAKNTGKHHGASLSVQSGTSGHSPNNASNAAQQQVGKMLSPVVQ